ncbi:MAG: hypothetical protein KAU21_17490, partial [Gammaproteobacteria bacterium]|nr:hypothetical protein [Gammaproteobacteria bacterium]
ASFCNTTFADAEAYGDRMYVAMYAQSGADLTCQWITAVDADGTNGIAGEIEAHPESGDVFYAARGKVSRINGSTGVVQWSKSVSNRDNIFLPALAAGEFPLASATTGLKVDATGNSYISGVYQNLLSFDGHDLEPAAAPTVFVARLDTLGNVEWVNSADRGTHLAVSSDSINAHIALDETKDQVFLAGNLLGSAKFSDESGTGSLGLITSNAAPSSDGSLEFDGVDDKLILPSNILNELNDFTVEFKFRIEPTAGGAIWSVVSAANGATDNELLIHLNRASVSVWINTRAITFHLSQGVMNDGLWHTISISRTLDTATGIATLAATIVDPAGTRTLGCGAAACTLINNSALSVAEGGLIIGQEQDSLGGGFDSNQAFNGRLDDLKFWATAIPPVAPDETGLIASYEFNTPFLQTDSLLNSTLIDSSINDNQIPWSTIVVAERPELVRGNSVAADNGILDFYDSANYLQLDPVILNGAYDYTVEMKIKLDPTVTQCQALVSGAESDAGNNEFLLYLCGQTLYTYDNGFKTTFTLNKPLNDGAWHTIRYQRNDVYDGGYNYSRDTILGLLGIPVGYHHNFTYLVNYSLTIDNGAIMSTCGLNNCQRIYNYALYGDLFQPVPDAPPHTFPPLSIAVNGLVFGQDQDSVGGSFDPLQNFDGQLDELAIWRSVTTA